MRAHATLILTFSDAGTAKAIAESVGLDDEDYIRTRRRGATIMATARATEPLALLHTLDDYLACISVAERTAEAARLRGRTRRRPG